MPRAAVRTPPGLAQEGVLPMHAQSSYPRPAKGTPLWQDWTFQRAVLVGLITLHPVQFIVSELIREIAVTRRTSAPETA